MPIPYYAGKVDQERQVFAANAPGTVLRATQFHEFAPQTIRRGLGPVALVPKMRTQPVAAVEVGTMAGGDLLPSGSGPRGAETFDEWLDRTASRDGEPDHA